MTRPGTIGLSEGTAYLQWFVGRSTVERIPIAGSFELTTRCNLRCVHCYLGSLRDPRAGEGHCAGSCAPALPASSGPPAQRPPRTRELTTPQIFAMLDEVAEAGCLYLLITGGEPLLHPDFAAVYRHAREIGLLVNVFTNATLVDDEICELFRELPPEMVDVSIYGATAATYEAVTQVEGSFDRCMSGIERLLAAGVRVGLKTVVMTPNVHELEAMRAIAAAHGVSFRYDAAVSAALDGDMAPVDVRLPEDVAIALELADEPRLDEWRRRFEQFRDTTVPARLYGCGAGVNAFFVDAMGTLHPCLMSRTVGHDVSEGGFAHGWTNVIPQVHELEPGGASGCVTCDARLVCDVCPGFVALETGAEDGWSEYLCRVGRARRAAVG